MRIRILLVVVLAVACGGGGKKVDTASTGAGGGDGQLLYDRLGGQDAIRAVVDEFVANVQANPQINAMFANADIPNLKTKLADQICQETGGPCKYTGKTMRDVHTGMNIKDSDFDALVSDLVKALDKFKVPEREKGELLKALEAMRADIVTAR